MRQVYYVPSDIKIAQDNLKRAISVRKNYEDLLLNIIREESQLFPHVDCKRMSEATFKVINALLIEYRAEEYLKQLRKEKRFNE